MPQTVGGTGSAVTIEAKIVFVEDGFEKFALPLRKNRSVGKFTGSKSVEYIARTLQPIPVMNVDRKAIPVLTLYIGCTRMNSLTVVLQRGRQWLDRRAS